LDSWELKSFEIDSPEKGKRSWGKDVRGLLFYSDTGHVSVAINRDLTDTGNPDKDQFDAILFYAGTYSVEGNVVKHQVTIASSPSRVGKEMVRFISMNGNEITLTSPPESFGTATVVWRKLG
jgi:hypothetical protein